MGRTYAVVYDANNMWDWGVFPNLMDAFIMCPNPVMLGYWENETWVSKDGYLDPYDVRKARYAR